MPSLQLPVNDNRMLAWPAASRSSAADHRVSPRVGILAGEDGQLPVRQAGFHVPTIVPQIALGVTMEFLSIMAVV